jgi:hypothetical protein
MKIQDLLLEGPATCSAPLDLEETRRILLRMKEEHNRMARFRVELLKRGIDPETVLEAFEASKGP